MKRMLWLGPLAILLLACGSRPEPEESVTIYDPKANAAFQKLLDEQQIPYRAEPDGQVFYPVSLRQKVQVARNQVLGSVGETARGVMTKDVFADEIASALKSANITFELHKQDQKAYFKWLAVDDQRATAIVKDILDRHGA